MLRFFWEWMLGSHRCCVCCEGYTFYIRACSSDIEMTCSNMFCCTYHFHRQRCSHGQLGDLVISLQPTESFLRPNPVHAYPSPLEVEKVSLLAMYRQIMWIFDQEVSDWKRYPKRLHITSTAIPKEGKC